MTSVQPATTEDPPPTGGRSRKVTWLLIVGLVLLANVAAFIIAPPFDPRPANPGDPCVYPVCFINGTLEFPAPHVLLPVGHHSPAGLVIWDISVSSSMFTMWIISAIIIVTLVVMTRGLKRLPGRGQNAIEAVYEGLEGFGTSLGGPAARPYIPLFVILFLYILLSNWSGLLPFVGRIPYLRAPTSDVNTTIGLALVSFSIFHIEGVRRLGLGGYLGKFFPIGEFKNGIGAGIIAMFVGLVELMLEFVKPLTLSMRLFGNIYGGEVALGVITALTLAFIPLALYGLELMLNLVQALIFSVLTLMFILAAIEGHHGEDEHHKDEPVATPVGQDELHQVVAAH